MTVATVDELDRAGERRALVAAITAQASEVRVGLALLGFLAALLMFVGRVPGRVVTGLVWAGVAVRAGYREGRGKTGEGVAG